MDVLGQIEFRRFQPEDLAAVKRLHAAALKATGAFYKSGPWDNDLEDIEGVYLNNGGDFLVGILDGEFVAMGAYRKLSDKKALLKRMRVRPDLQGQGIGRQLLELLEQKIKEHGYKTIELDTTVNQAVARHIYESAGYKEVRRSTEGPPDMPLETIFYEKRI